MLCWKMEYNKRMLKRSLFLSDVQNALGILIVDLFFFRS